MQNVIQDPIVEAETVAIISDHKTSQCVSMRISKRIITNIFSSEIVSSRSAETEEICEGHEKEGLKETVLGRAITWVYFHSSF